ncbi:hypothetical protein POPTR_003G025032v4 [Populus trichocarpa]|uniref:Uncharacterized protein n=2 Tax=Populus trichocarpa TaxID=3694 RepID=A0ACC0T7F4_POPTR|nr:hypothetical protein POPTR_003G025032v4 [Populus trichocarpa]
MDFLLLLSTHVGLCWPFVLVFAASVPVFSPSFASGFGGLFNGSSLLVLSLELSYIFSLSIRCFLFPLFLASIIALLSLFFVPCKFDCTSLYVLHVVICLPFDHAIFFFLCYFGLCCLAFDHGASVVTFSFLPLCMIYWSFFAYA